MAPKRAASPAAVPKSKAASKTPVAAAARAASPAGAATATLVAGGSASPTAAPSHKAAAVLSNKSGAPSAMIADMIAKGTGHDYAYSPTADYAAGKRVRSGRAYLPPAWATAWLAAAAFVSVWSAVYVLGKESGFSDARAAPSADALRKLAAAAFAPFHAYGALDKTFAFSAGAAAKPALRKTLLEAFAVVGYGEGVFALLFLFMTVGMEAPGASVFGLIASTVAAVKEVRRRARMPPRIAAYQ